jgi:WD40 repeat protein
MRHYIVLRDVSGKDRRFNAPGVVAVAFSTDGKTLISGHQGGVIRLWDADTFTERAPATDGQRMSDAILSPDGRTLAFHRDKEKCFDNREIRLWDMAAGREIGGFPTERWAEVHLAFAPDGKTLAAVNNSVIFLLEVDARKLLRDFHQRQLINSTFCATAFAPDGKALVTGECDGSVRLWNPADGKEQRRLVFKNSEKVDDKYQMDVVEAVGFSPDGRALAALGWTPSYGVRMSVWDCETNGGAPQLAWNTTTPDMPNYSNERSFLEVRPMLPSFLFTPDGHMLAVSRCQKTIPIWEAATGRQRLLLAGHQEPCNYIAMTRDGRTLASSGCDNTIRLWDLETGDPLRTLTGHRGPANALVFSADGKTLVSTGNDTTMLFWDVAAVTQRPKPKVVALSPEECKSLWTDLAGADAAKAYKAIRAFSAAPAQTASFLGERLRPARSAKKEEVDRLIAELDSDDFQVREKAASELEELGGTVGPALRQVIAGRPSAEVRARVNRLLEKLATPAPELLRNLRALEALEAVGGAEARQVVERIAKGAAEARLTRDAKAALARLDVSRNR